MEPVFDRSASDMVLIVDDLPDNLSVLHDALDEAGYTVLVATSGKQALSRAAQVVPDIILLDAMMPQMDGFEVARLLKADPKVAHIPIVFMTSLTETEHVVRALDAGGVDFITKPIKPREVLARMNVHLQGARLARQTRLALDAFGCAAISVALPTGKVLWQTPLARELLARFFPDAEQASAVHVPVPVQQWLNDLLLAHSPAQGTRSVVGATWSVVRTSPAGVRKLVFTVQPPTDDSEWLVVVRETSDAALIDAIAQEFQLTAREAEVTYWVLKGKINRDIGDILGSSPMTVKKHLERIFSKLGVETRTAAAAMVLARIRLTHPHVES